MGKEGFITNRFARVWVARALAVRSRQANLEGSTQKPEDRQVIAPPSYVHNGLTVLAWTTQNESYDYSIRLEGRVPTQSGRRVEKGRVLRVTRWRMQDFNPDSRVDYDIAVRLLRQESRAGSRPNCGSVARIGTPAACDWISSSLRARIDVRMS